MRTQFSTVSRVGYLIIVIAVIYFLTELAYGWSLDETTRFSLLIFGQEWARPASWIIQLGPQALLLLSGLATQPGKGRRFNLWTISGLSLVAALGLNVIDTMTNIGAYVQWQRVMSDVTLEPFVRDMAYALGFVFCFLVTWSEEVMILLAGVGVHLIGMLLGNFGRRPPRWFAVDAVDLAWAASGAKAAGIPKPESEERGARGEGRQGQHQQGQPVRVHSDGRPHGR